MRQRGIRLSLCAICVICGFVSMCAVPTARADEGSTYSVVICGIGGDAEYEKIIEGWGKELNSALRKNGVADDHVFWLSAKKAAGVYAESRSDQIVQLFDKLAARVGPQDVFQLFLIGHGSFDDYDYRFNIPGPDLTATQLNGLLGRIRAERQLVVNMTSSSGASLMPLRRKGRVVITSTSVGRERNFTQFARYFIAALEEPAADADKNQEITALEAFRYASHEVARYFQSLKRLATEHAMLEDRGDSEGSREPSAENGQGLLASSLVLVRLGSQNATVDPPEVRALRANKRKIEEEIEGLKYRKATLPSEEYSKQLETLLVELSKAQQRLDNLEKK